MLGLRLTLCSEDMEDGDVKKILLEEAILGGELQTSISGVRHEHRSI